MTKTAIKQAYKNYINDSFDLELLNLSIDSTPKERATAFLQLIKGRHSNHSTNPLQNTVNHLHGLREGINIEFMNYAILEQAKSFGLIDSMMNNARFSKMVNKELALDHVKNQIIRDYWAVLATYIHQMAR